MSVIHQLKRAIRPLYRGGRAFAGGPLAHLKLVRARAGLRATYGKHLNTTIAPHDEMLMFLQDVLKRHPEVTQMEYLRSGESMLKDLQNILGKVGLELDRIGSLLEFACGYGRFTRFLITQTDPKRVTVADIDPAAVDFVRANFQVKGFYSTQEASALHCTDKFDLIFVASLFSHLAIEHWKAWAARLTSMLSDDGLLVFSTHGFHGPNAWDEAARMGLRQVEEGFFYDNANETKGRLIGDYYGTGYQTTEFVKRFFGRGLGEVKAVIPKGLWDFQDVYIIAGSRDKGAQLA